MKNDTTNIYLGFSREWYYSVGNRFILLGLINTFSPHFIEVFLEAPFIKIIGRILQKSATTMKDIVDFKSPQDFIIGEHYGSDIRI